VEIVDLKIETYTDDGDVDMLITSPRCVYDRKSGSARSKSALRVAREGMVLTGEGYTWDAATQRFTVYEKAKLVIKRDKTLGHIKGDTR
jgi:hypothetical protein